MDEIEESKELERKWKNYVMQKLRNLEKNQVGTEMVLIKELFQSFTCCESIHGCLINCCLSCLTCCVIVFLSVCFFAVFLYHIIEYASDDSYISSEQTKLYEKESSDKLFPMVFFCVFDIPNFPGATQDVNFIDWSVIHNLEDWGSKFTWQTFTHTIKQTKKEWVEDIEHQCVVFNYELNNELEVKDIVESEGFVFPVTFTYTLQRKPANYTSFFWFFPLHRDYLTDPETKLKETYGSAEKLYEYIFMKSREEPDGFTPTPSYGVFGGTNLINYSIEKKYRDNRYQILDMMLIGLIWSFRSLQYIRYKVDMTEAVSGKRDVDVCVGGVCTYTNVVSIYIETSKYREIVEKYSKTDFTAPFFAAGGMLITLKILPDIIMKICQCLCLKWYGSNACMTRRAKGTIRKVFKKSGRKKFKRLLKKEKVMGEGETSEEEERGESFPEYNGEDVELQSVEIELKKDAGEEEGEGEGVEEKGEGEEEEEGEKGQVVDENVKMVDDEREDEEKKDDGSSTESENHKEEENIKEEETTDEDKSEDGSHESEFSDDSS